MVTVSILQKRSVFQILKLGISLYIQHFGTLSKVMVFPIIAHIVGISWIVTIAMGLDQVIEPTTSPWIFLPLYILLPLPGFWLFLKGFWAYLVAMSSLNLQAKDLCDSESEKNCQLYKKAIEERSISYIEVLTLMMLLWIVGIGFGVFPIFLTGIIPEFMVIIGTICTLCFGLFMVLVVSIYFSLGFQVFAFEKPSVLEVFKHSAIMVSSHFWRVLLITIILYLLTGVILPFAINLFIDITRLEVVLVSPFSWFASHLIDKLTTVADYYNIAAIKSMIQGLNFSENPTYFLAESLLYSTIDGIITAGMLPLGSICFTLLYFDIKARKGETG